MSINKLTSGSERATRVRDLGDAGRDRLDATEDTLLVQQAQAIAAHLPALMRHLFTFEDDAAADLPLAQLRVCALLLNGPRPMSAVSRELNVSLSATTQLADRLERSGLVQRVANETDRRLRCLQLTARGEAILRQREAARNRRVQSVLAQLSPATRQDILGALQALLQECQRGIGHGQEDIDPHEGEGQP